MDAVIQDLEDRLKIFIEQCNDLKQTNVKLRQNETKWLREKDLLLAKHKIAISQIESMVLHLKSIEKQQ